MDAYIYTYIHTYTDIDIDGWTYIYIYTYIYLCKIMVRRKIPNIITSGKQDPNHLEIMIPNFFFKKETVLRYEVFIYFF